MREAELIELENKMINEVLRRRTLGEFDANAGTILRLCEWIYKLTGHLIELESAKKKVKRK